MVIVVLNAFFEYILKIFRFIWTPFALIWWLITSMRNLLYDLGLKKSVSFPNVFIINVGNLAIGGSGKSPLVEYLIRLLASEYNVAVLSRGYLRKTKGFVLATQYTTVDEIGDEPMQFYSNFKNVTIAVCEKRVNGTQELLRLFPKLQIIILDDAFQHRAIQPDFSIMVSEVNNPFTNDFVLPLGNLRETRFGAKRASLIVFSKSINSLNALIKKSHYYSDAPVLFSSINYLPLYDLATKNLVNFPKKAILVTGIVTTYPILNYLNTKVEIVKHFEFRDHYKYSQKDIKLFKEYQLPIITTQKDAVKLQNFKELNALNLVIVLPIGISFLEGNDKFNSIIFEAISNKNTINL